MKIQDPSGQVWRVTRRWVPWRRRLKGWLSDINLPVSFGDDPISLIIFVLFGIPVLVILAIAGLEFLLVTLLLPFALLGRILFGHHWTIEARRGFRIWHQQTAGDWQSSGLAIHSMADRIRHGEIPPHSVAPETREPQA